MLALGLALAAVIGLSLGLLGGGGSILTVPILVYVLGFDAKPAIAMSLAVVGATSLAGAALHRRMGNLRLEPAVTFGLVAMAGAFAGAKLASLLSGTTQLVLLAIVMVVAAGSMLRGGRVEAEASSSPKLLPLAAAGAGVGVLTGIVGIGGGFLIVPALVVLARLPMREAVGTSLLVIAMNSAAGLAGYLGSVPLDWGFLAGFTATAIAGAFVGARLAVRVPQHALKRGFAVFLLAVGVLVLYRNRGALHGAPTSTSRAAIESSARATTAAADVR
jgi:uncharacterized membrane protein YfcA